MSGSKPSTAVKGVESEVTAEDQQRINNFAKLNTKLEEIKESLKTKKKELEDMQDAMDELIMTDDDQCHIPLQIGGVFIMEQLDEVQVKLEMVRTRLDKDVEELQTNHDIIKQKMATLKVELYGKFGQSINLEADED